MDFYSNEKEYEILLKAQDIAEQVFKPLREQYDREQLYCPQAVKALAEAGFFGVWLPKEYGGAGLGLNALSLILEELSKTCAGLAMPLATTALGLMPVLFCAQTPAHKNWLKEAARGEKLWAFALSEATAGSDAGALKSTAIKENGSYILNGAKHFVSSGEIADYYLIAASTNPARGARGVSLFVVPKDAQGMLVTKKENKLGLRSNPTCNLALRNVKIPAENLIGEEGQGLLIVKQLFDYSRPAVASQATGIALGALEETVKYLKIRRQFGQNIINFQSVGFTLAELYAKISAARALAYKITSDTDKYFIPAANYAVANKTALLQELKIMKAPRQSAQSASAKFFGAKIADETANACLTLCGGIGYMRDFPLEKYLRDAKALQIYEGTAQMQLSEILADLIKNF